MKDFITAIASVLILMMFVMQFAANQASFTKIMGAEYAIREMRLVSENQGIISSESIAQLKEKLSEILGCGTGEIIHNLSGAAADTENTGSQPLSCILTVEMPVYGVIGPARMLGIGPGENVRTHTSESIIVLMPQAEEGTAPETEEAQQ